MLKCVPIWTAIIIVNLWELFLRWECSFGIFYTLQAEYISPEHCSFEISLGNINILPTSILQIYHIFSLFYIGDITEITKEIIYLMILHVLLKFKRNEMVIRSTPIIIIIIRFYLFDSFNTGYYSLIYIVS